MYRFAGATGECFSRRDAKNDKFVNTCDTRVRNFSLRKQMEQYAWILWIVFGVFFIIAEIFTLGFVLFWFGIAALAAALAASLGVGYFGQFLIFAGVAIVLTVMSRTIFDNYYPRSDEEGIKTGMDTLPGQIGTVKTGSKGALNTATVNVYGSDWKAFPIDEETIFEEGEKVEVVRVEGSSIYVRKAKGKELPDWRGDGV
jgi:membrane protein implicated in regulation of membrane protease activity